MAISRPSENDIESGMCVSGTGEKNVLPNISAAKNEFKLSTLVQRG